MASSPGTSLQGLLRTPLVDDNGKLSKYWANTLLSLQGNSYLADAVGAVARSLLSKISEILSVADFGALGDGVNDDGPAIAAAITAAGVQGRLYFPRANGVYLSSVNLKFLNGQTWYAPGGAQPGNGGGGGGVVIRYTGAAGAGALIAPINPAVNTFNITLRNIQFDGNLKASPTCDFTRVSFVTAQSCNFSNGRDAGYTTGTVAVVNTSAAVVGTGTAWTSAMRGGSITVGATTAIIASVTDATHLTLTAGFAGGTVAGVAYTIYTGVNVLLDAAVSDQCYKNSFTDCKFDGPYVQLRLTRGANTNHLERGSIQNGTIGIWTDVTSVVSTFHGTNMEGQSVAHVVDQSGQNGYIAIHMEDSPIGYDFSVGCFGCEVIAPTYAGTVTTRVKYSAIVATTVALNIAAGAGIVVTPASMANIVIGSVLYVANSDRSNAEFAVTVTGVTGATFTATFATTKTGPGIVVSSQFPYGFNRNEDYNGAFPTAEFSWGNLRQTTSAFSTSGTFAQDLYPSNGAADSFRAFDQNVKTSGARKWLIYDAQTGTLRFTLDQSNGNLTAVGSGIFQNALAVTNDGTFQGASAGFVTVSGSERKILASGFAIDIFFGSTTSTAFFDALPGAGAASTFGFFRNTNTAGTRQFIVYKGDGTATANFVINADTGALTGPHVQNVGTVDSPSFTSVTLNGAQYSSGNGSPNGSVTGSVGDIYTNRSGGASTTLYVKESGAGTNTGWAAK